MKPQMTRSKKLPSPVSNSADGEISLSFQNELVATIQGAFEVAVEIAVLEITKLVGQAMGDVRDQMHETQRENESLKQRLKKSEEKLEAVRNCMGEGYHSPSKHLVSSQTALLPSPQDTHTTRNLKELQDNEMKVEPVQDVTQSLVEEELEEQDNGTFTEICEDGRVFSQQFPNPTSRQSVAHDDLPEESNEEASSLTVAKAGGLKHPDQDASFQHDNLPPLPSGVVSSTGEQVRIKEEEAMGGNGSDCRFNTMIEDDFGADSLSLAQSKMLEEWKPELLDIQNHNPDSLIPGTSLALAHPPNMNPDVPELSVTSSSGLPSFSSQFPNLFQPGEPAPIPAPPQVYGAQVRNGRNPSQPTGGLHACKICGQAFHQPSQLRRHYGQCQQKLQQRNRQPVVGSKRTKLQLYPPGCSPFHCTECNRDFNRLENLKTHLRIHTGERPYTCSVCSMRFRHSGALTRHFRIHTGEKPYICGLCGKTFRNCGGLKFHQRSHNRQ